MLLEVLAAEVALRRQEHLNVLGRGVEDRGEVGGGHLECRGYAWYLANNGDVGEGGLLKGSVRQNFTALRDGLIFPALQMPRRK